MQLMHICHHQPVLERGSCLKSAVHRCTPGLPAAKPAKAHCRCNGRRSRGLGLATSTDSPSRHTAVPNTELHPQQHSPVAANLWKLALAAGLWLPLLATVWWITAPAAQAAELSAEAAQQIRSFKPEPVQVGWQAWTGLAAATAPLVIATFEFTKRIMIQRRCEGCRGSGLVQRGGKLRKCLECGGFFPWQGWSQFLSATASPGNGGPLQQPRGQTSVFYKVPPVPERKEEQNKD